MLDTQRLDINLESNRQYLPPGSELLESDDIPVDNEDQNWIPNVLLMLLKNIWIESRSERLRQRTDWFFGVDMGVYHATSKNARVPIGRCPEIFAGSNEEVLSWFDDRGDQCLRAEEKEIQARVEAVQARAEADRARQRAEKLLAKLQELGIDADGLE
jgi:hypothetical protein